MASIQALPAPWAGAANAARFRLPRRLRWTRPGGAWACQGRGVATSSPSYAEGPKEPPLLQVTIPDHFASIVSQYGDRTAVMCRSPTVADALTAAQARAHEPALTTSLTYAALDSLSNTLANSLKSLGVTKGARVAVSLGNILENAALTYAIYKLGAVLVPLNPAFTDTQLTAALSHLGVEVLITGAVTDLPYKPCRGRSNYDTLEMLIPGLGSRGYLSKLLPNISRKVESPHVPTLKTVIVVDNTASHPDSAFPALEELRALTPFTSLLQGSGAPVTPDSPLTPEETINIQFTSGTTADPKAAMLSHKSILNNGALIAARMGLKPSDRIVVPPPLFHCFGSVLGYMATATTGAAVLFPSPAFEPGASLRMVTEQEATGLYGVATMFNAELALARNQSFAARTPAGAYDTLHKGIVAGSSVPEALVHELMFETLGIQDLVICYGMTETSPVSVMTSPTDPIDKRTKSVGTVMPHTTVKIVDPSDRSKILPVGQPGELATSGYLVMNGYYKDEATDKDLVADDEGTMWMYSGDGARMDQDGYIQITGRVKDLIIRGGENVRPAEVENCLFKMPGIHDVSVVGVPDERYGEVATAFVVPVQGDGWQVAPEKTQPYERGNPNAKLHWRPGLEWKFMSISQGVRGLRRRREKELKRGIVKVLSKANIRMWVKDRMGRAPAPKYIYFLDEFPKTPSGKIQKYKLREMALERMQLGEPADSEGSEEAAKKPQ